ncbi:hypothetical protein Fcan01_11300 [Folsomia candida]|uniref:Uncharacterized protein n=1 Tax=Folsomia candida TaxID=158441 RepID=A0A226EAH2_FOLCA|nr:hypothetical protein Fcan01_11300 [Folsomia candida]
MSISPVFGLQKVLEAFFGHAPIMIFASTTMIYQNKYDRTRNSLSRQTALNVTPPSAFRISPTSKDQKTFAKAIFLVIPSWRYPGSADGTDTLFDQIGRGGLIQGRLRHIHRSLNKDTPKVLRKRALPRTEDSSQKPVFVESEVADDLMLALIRKLSGLCPKTEEQEIKRLMHATLPHRSILRQTNQLEILNTYKKFLECDFLINFEFSLMHENSVENFVDIWSAAAPKIRQKGPEINKTPALQKFFLEESSKFFSVDRGTAPQGQGRGSRSNIGDAKELLISFFKVGTPLQSILDTWPDRKIQPNLVYLGDNKKDITSFFIVCDRKIMPIAAVNTVQAIDCLFKSHYVFATEYDKNLSGFWKFIQVYLYKLDVETTRLPRKVKEVYSQLAICHDIPCPTEINTWGGLWVHLKAFQGGGSIAEIEEQGADLEEEQVRQSSSISGATSVSQFPENLELLSDISTETYFGTGISKIDMILTCDDRVTV